MLCDIKLIRDKIYHTENEELKEFHENEDKNAPMT